MWPWLCHPCRRILPSRLETVDLLFDVSEEMRFPKLIICIFYFILFSGHMTLDCCEGTWLAMIAAHTVNCWEKMTYLCCRIGHTTDGRETTVGIRRGVVCCGRGGELKDGGPVFIYKYPYFCVLSCKLCRN